MGSINVHTSLPAQLFRSSRNGRSQRSNTAQTGQRSSSKTLAHVRAELYWWAAPTPEGNANRKRKWLKTIKYVEVNASSCLRPGSPARYRTASPRHIPSSTVKKRGREQPPARTEWVERLLGCRTWRSTVERRLPLPLRRRARRSLESRQAPHSRRAWRSTWRTGWYRSGESGRAARWWILCPVPRGKGLCYGGSSTDRRRISQMFRCCRSRRLCRLRAGEERGRRRGKASFLGLAVRALASTWVLAGAAPVVFCLSDRLKNLPFEGGQTGTVWKSIFKLNIFGNHIA